MTKEEVDILVNRFNKFYTPKPSGFINCSVITYEPVKIAYDFNSGPNADLFLMSRELIPQTSTLSIDPQNICRVIEVRQGKNE